MKKKDRTKEQFEKLITDSLKMNFCLTMENTLHTKENFNTILMK